MNITRHPLCVGLSTPDLWNLPPDQETIQRLRQTFAMLGATAVSSAFCRIVRCRALSRDSDDPTATESTQEKLAASLDAVMAHLDAPKLLRQDLANIGNTLASFGINRDRSETFIGSMMAALVDLSNSRWKLDTIQIWSDAVQLMADVIFEEAAPTK